MATTTTVYAATSTTDNATSPHDVVALVAVLSADVRQLSRRW